MVNQSLLCIFGNSKLHDLLVMWIIHRFHLARDQRHMDTISDVLPLEPRILCLVIWRSLTSLKVIQFLNNTKVMADYAEVVPMGCRQLEIKARLF